MTVKKTMLFDFSPEESKLINDFRGFIEDLNEEAFNAILEVTKNQNFIDSITTIWDLAYVNSIYVDNNEDNNDFHH